MQTHVAADYPDSPPSGIRVALRPSDRQSDWLASASVLIVDDDPVAIQVLRASLREYSDVRFATSAKGALASLQEREADLILLDAEMPGESGFEFCARLKRHPLFREIPVIFVTSHDDMAFEVRALESGASDFLVKPVSSPRVRLRARLHLRLKRQLDQLHELAVTDVLTGLANRRAFDDAMARECAAAARSGRCLSLIIADVDHFKRLNDEEGHPAGDRCLRSLARTIRRAAGRPTDIAARIGGEEFALLLPDTPVCGAQAVAESLLESVAALAIPHPNSSVGPHVSLSVGTCTLPVGTRVELPATKSTLLRLADQALYLAKRRGRGRIASVAYEYGSAS